MSTRAEKMDIIQWVVGLNDKAILQQLKKLKKRLIQQKMRNTMHKPMLPDQMIRQLKILLLLLMQLPNWVRQILV